MKKKLERTTKKLLVCGFAAVCLATPAAYAGNVTNVFGFQQNNLTKDGSAFGSGTSYAGMSDGSINDGGGTGIAYGSTGVVGIGNQYIATSGQNGQQFIGLFACDLTELNSFLATNTTATSTAQVVSVSLQLVANGGAGSGPNVEIYQTDPFTSSANWTNNGSGTWSAPWQSGLTQAAYGWTGGGSKLSANIAANSYYIYSGSYVAGTVFTLSNSVTFDQTVSNALNRTDHKLYLMAAPSYAGNSDGRLYFHKSSDATPAYRPTLQISVQVIGTPSSSGPSTWTGASSTSWATAGNWSPTGVPAANTPILFNSSSTANLSTVLNQNFTVSNLSLTTPSGAVSIAGPNTLTINSGIDMSAANQNLMITVPINLNSAQTWNVASGQTLGISGAVAGSVNLTIAGAGTVSAGAANVLPNGSSGGNLILNGTLDLNGNNESINALSGTGTVVNSGSAATLTLGYNNSGDTFSGTMQGPTGLTKMGTGTEVLAGASTYTGNTTISNGTLVVANASALGSTSGGTVVISGAALALTNGITLFGEPITINGSGISGVTGAVRTADPNNPVTLAAPITLGGDATIGTGLANGQLIVTGSITDNGNNRNLTLNSGLGGSVLRINSAGNTVSNVTLYTYLPTSGLITFGVDNSFPSSLLSPGDGKYDLNGTAQQFIGLSQGYYANGNQPHSVIDNSSATTSTLTLNVPTNTSYSTKAAIQGNINLVKNGPGTESLTGGTWAPHYYTGTTTINGGILALASDMSGVTGTITVNNTGTLRGIATIGGSVDVKSGGTFYSGYGSNTIGAMTINGNLTLEPGSITIACINPDLAISNDVVTVGGTLTYGGTLVVYSIGHTNALQAGETFTIFPNGGSGNFNNVVFNSFETQPGTSVSFNPATGTVTVTGTTAPTVAVAPQGGNQMQINWSSSFYKLQYQTNALDTGLSSNWTDYSPAMTNGQSSVTTSNNPAIPCTFFRVVPKP